MPESPRTPRVLPPFQFSLLWLLIAVTIVAVFLGLASLLGEGLFELIWVGAIFCVLPTPLIILTIFGRGELRTFSIGGLVPWVWFWLNQTWSNLGSVEAVLIGIWLPLTGAACGAAAVATRRWLDRRDEG